MEPGAGSAIVVRRATSEDAEQIAEVIASGVKELRRTYRPRESASSGAIGVDVVRLVAVVDDRIVGTVRYHRQGDALAIVGLDVIETYRRRGVARALVEHVAEAARGEGAARLSLCTVRETGNEAVFQGLGFATVQEQPSEIFEAEGATTLTELTMERPVASAGA